MQVSRNDLRTVVSPTLGALFTAALATLAVMYIQWETWTVMHGKQDAFTSYYYYWPLYTYTHTDAIRPPSSIALVLNFIAGVVICYFPTTVLVTGVRRISNTAQLSVPTASGWVGDALRLRPRLAFWTVVFAFFASLIPPGFGISLYMIPGLIVVMFLEGGIGAIYPPLLDTLPNEFMWAVAVPSAFPVWYVVFILIGGAVRFARTERNKGR